MNRPDRLGRAFPLFRAFSRSVGAKLFAFLLAALVLVFGLLGYLNIRLHRKNLEAVTLSSAERVSDVIKRSASYYMMRNDREGLYHIINTFGSEPGVTRVRIFNKEGRISFSTDSSEVGTFVNKDAEACYACHAQSQPLVRLNRPDRFRIFQPAGQRLLGIITPLYNSQSCAETECHAHPIEQQVLGVLDTNLSLADADRNLAASTRQMMGLSVIGVLAISMMSGLFVWRFVHRRVKSLVRGTEKLAEGELGYQIGFRSQDELGELAGSFNEMSRELLSAREEVTGWARTLEERVEQKTSELRRANEQMLQAEKMSSLGKMSAVVAHEINNPLSGILTYARLMRRWIDRGDDLGPRSGEIRESLMLIESESRRCGEIVKNLLSFSRVAPMNVESVDLNRVIGQSVRLIEHKLELNNIELNLQLADPLPRVHGDAAQLEQLLLALIMNAIEAIPHEGRLTVRTAASEGTREVRVEVEDDGIGIPADILPRLFEPFVTTKEQAHGVGLGLAISKGIVERHHGRIEVRSQAGKGTVFTIHLPAEAGEPEPASAGAGSAKGTPRQGP